MECTMEFTIESARKFAGKTQMEMAKLLGIDRGTYRKIEKDENRATLQQLKTISGITGVPIRNFNLSK